MELLEACRLKLIKSGQLV